MNGTQLLQSYPFAYQTNRYSFEADINIWVENPKIFDLLRNDLSRVCLPGSVTVPRLFTIEAGITLNQITP